MAKSLFIVAIKLEMEWNIDITITTCNIDWSYIPERWRRVKVTFITKIGEKDGTEPKSFLWSLLKTMKKYFIIIPEWIFWRVQNCTIALTSKYLKL